MAGTIQLPHACPNGCGTVAKTAVELEKLFGYRTLPSGVHSQSWCRECRSKKKG